MIPSFLVTLFGKRNKVTNLKSEDALSVEVADYLVVKTLKSELGCLWFHVPNEAGRNTAYYSIIQRAKGVVAGVADFIFLRPLNPFCIELKVDTKQSEKQKAFEAWCLDRGIKYYIARSLNEVVDILLDEGCISKI